MRNKVLLQTDIGKSMLALSFAILAVTIYYCNPTRYNGRNVRLLFACGATLANVIFLTLKDEL